MYMVYWTVVDGDGYEAKSRLFDTELLDEPMKFVNELREKQYADGSIKFVVMSSENPNMVGKMGASAPDASYNWTKRRGGSNHPSRGDLSHYKDH